MFCCCSPFYRPLKWFQKAFQKPFLLQTKGHGRPLKHANGLLANLKVFKDFCQDNQNTFRGSLGFLVCFFLASFVRWYQRSFIRSFQFVRSSVHSFRRSFVRSFARSLARSFVLSLAGRFVCCQISALIHPFVRSMAC